MKKIYLDHAATTPLHPDVIEAMYEAQKNLFGNPSSIHSYGREARSAVDHARRTIAKAIGADERELIFTSGGTESNNLALIGTALAHKDKGKHIITSAQEHSATLDAAHYLETIGFQVTYVPVDEKGLVQPADIFAALTEETILVSIMTVNNETGVIQPIEEIGKELKDKNIVFHTDAVQAFGSIDLDVKKMDIDLLTISAHKINGPKGVGCLYCADHIVLQSIIHGGEQERRRRPGTENVTGIIGFTAAVKAMEKSNFKHRILDDKHKTLFLNTLSELNVSYEINGALQLSVPTIVNISFPETEVETLLTNLDLEGIAASSGSACTAGSVQASHVLLAMFGEDNERIKNSIRFSFGLHLTTEDIIEAAKRISQVIQRIT